MKNKRIIVAILLVVVMLFTFVACGDKNNSHNNQNVCTSHIDANHDNICDICGASISNSQHTSHIDTDDDGHCDICGVVIVVNGEEVVIDFYSVNDLHGKYLDSDTQPGADNLTTFFKEKQASENTVLLSTGDMWQGSVESNKTHGMLATEWMNSLGFVGMAYGNHEFDWGDDYIRTNEELAEFPFLAINIYERSSNTLADYCTPSVMVEIEGVEIGIIGAIGDCYSSISSDKVRDVYFKTGDQLSALVKEESQALRAQGADYIVFAVHDGFDAYDLGLSNGYVDLVFEGHTHSSYVRKDLFGVYHLQGGGENKGIAHAKVTIPADRTQKANVVANTILNSVYSKYASDPIINELVQKYIDLIGDPARVVGYNSRYRSSEELEEVVAQLYYNLGIELWGQEYPIVLGGGFLRARNPYSLDVGNVTYSMLNGIFPFDNPIQLCTIKGVYLREKFFFTQNTDYHIYYGSFGAQVMNNIDDNATYYIVVDSYTSQYAPNHLTVVAEYDADVMARDLLADYIGAGNFA